VRNGEMQFDHVSLQDYLKMLQEENAMPVSVKRKWHLMILLLGDLLCE
jgi:hypothetical protein